MVRDTRYKLIYYPQGNVTQLFDLRDDPRETRDLSRYPEHTDVMARLTDLLTENMYGGDMEWVDGGKLVGTPDPNPGSTHPSPNKSFGNQRGYRFGHSGPATNMPSRM